MMFMMSSLGNRLGRRWFFWGVGVCVGCVVGAAEGGNLFPSQERVDFADRKSMACGIFITQGGQTGIPVLLTDGDMLPTADINADSLGWDYASDNKSGQAVNEVNGERLVCGSTNYINVGEGILYSNFISNVTAFAAFDNNLFQADSNGTLAIYNTTTGELGIHPNFFAIGVGGMSAERTQSGELRLLVGRGTEVTEYKLSGDPYTAGELQKEILQQDITAGFIGSLGINGLDFSNGALFVNTLMGTAEFPYQLTQYTHPMTTKDASAASVTGKPSGRRAATPPMRP